MADWMRGLAWLTLASTLVACTGPAKTLTTVRSSADWSGTPAPTATEAAPSTVPGPEVLSVRYTGGMCPNGMCDSEVVVRQDGSFSRTSNMASPGTGRVNPADVAVLIREIEKADFAAIRSVKFTGTCPIAYDGQELIYTFHLAGGPETIASCKVQVDADSPLFKAVNKVLAQTEGQ